MSVPIRVTPEALLEASGRLTAGAGAIDGELASLAAVVEEVVGAMWAGQASDQFRALWEQWHQSGRQLHEALLGVATLVRHAGEAYASTDTQVAASFR